MKNAKLHFLIIVALVLLFGCVCFFGAPSLNVAAVSDTENGIRLGLDLVGGSYMTYEARDFAKLDIEELANGMDTVIQLLQGRLDNLGYFEAVVTRVGANRVTVEIPSIGDPTQAEAQLGSMAELLLVDSDGVTVCSGADIISATPKYGKITEDGPNKYYVNIKLTPSGKSVFFDATVRMSTPEKIAAFENYIVIKLDGEVRSMPAVKSAINSDEFIIEGDFSEEGAKWLAHVISAGRLPFALDLVDSNSIGPTLGEKSLETSMQAGVVGLALVMLYMLVFYRLQGLVANISLLLYTLMFGVMLSALRVNLSLPGIAGIILSIGMAVDANIIIFERIKEELRFGKTVRSAVKSGFSRGIGAIVDSNITTIIAGVVLKFLGTGPIVGFANTLLIGVVLSMFTSIVASKALLTGLVEMGFSKLVYFGVKEEDKPVTAAKYRFTARKGIFLICAFVILAAGTSSMVQKGFVMDVDFTGGTKMTVETHTVLDREKMDEIADVVQSVCGARPTVQKSGENGSIAIFKLPEQSSEGRAALFLALEGAFGITADDRLSVQSISAAVGNELIEEVITAVITAAVLILIYVAVRFELASGFVAVLMLLHDVLVMLAMYTLFGIPFGTSFVAAILTIVGYSINDTIVIFDRIRENQKIYEGRTFEDIVDLSITQTLARSVGTTVTTLLTTTMLYIMGVASIKALAFPLIIGIAAGLYTSVVLAGPVWAMLRNKQTV